MFRFRKLFSVRTYASKHLFGSYSTREFPNGKPFSTAPVRSGVHMSLNVQDNIAVISLDSPGKVNVLNLDGSKEIESMISEVENNSDIIGSVLISKKPNCFIAGADIDMLEKIQSMEQAREMTLYVHGILQKVEASKKPYVAAVMGTCMGGGLEVALACHYRLAVKDKSVFSLPEVMLGILPGAGGTQRLPKLIGLPNSLDMILTGKNVPASKAKSFGLVDSLVSPLGPGIQPPDERTLEYLKDIAIQTTRNIAVGNLKIKRAPKGFYNKIIKKVYDTKLVRDYIFRTAKTRVMNQTNGLYPAPLEILDVVKIGLEVDSKAGYKAEAQSFGELVVSDKSRGLVNLFRGINKCKKHDISDVRVDSVAVLGAGLMGAGIADVSIRKGLRTILKDTNQQGLLRGQKQVEKSLQKSLKRNKLTKLESERMLSSLHETTDYDKFSNVDVVIEAVFEEINLKQSVLKEVESRIPEDSIYATNTSALLVTKIAEASKRPEKVIGMHYFSPVDKMQLIEIIKTKATSKETLQKALAVGLRHGKIPIIVNDSPAFYTTRIFMAFVLEGFRILCEGVDPKTLDSHCMDAGFPAGCITLADEVGIDVGFHVYSFLIDVFGERMRSVDLNLGRDVTETGMIGRKAGRGAYIYNGNSKEKFVNQDVLKIVEKYRIEPKVSLTPENIHFRIISRFVNEAAMCLEKGVIEDPLEGDVGAVFGVGFPPFLGGPFHYIDTFGAGKFVDKMRVLEEGYGISFSPCQLLVDYAKDSSKKFHKRSIQV